MTYPSRIRRLGGLLAPALLISCGEKIDAVQPAPVQAAACEATYGHLSYDGDIQPLLDKFCTGCHSSTLGGAARNSAPPGVNLDSYALVKGVLAAANRRIQAGTMPPTGALSDGDRGRFACWVDQGATEKVQP